MANCHDCVLRSERAKRRRSPFGIVPSENAEVEELRDWKVDCGDIRADPGIAREISEFIEKHRVLSVTMTDGVFGCPHQEGNNYEGKMVTNLRVLARTADEFSEVDAVPAILAEQRVGIDHGLNAPIECLNVLVKGTAGQLAPNATDANATSPARDSRCSYLS